MCGEIHLGTPGRNFLFTKPFCGENVLLHSKSNWNVSTIILVRIQIVSIEEYFKLFGFGEAFKLRQYIITFTVQNFLLSRKNSANKEVCNSFFLSTITQVSVTVANLIAISIEIAPTNPESAEQSVYIFITILKVAISGWFYFPFHDFFEIVMILIITNKLLKVIPCSCKVRKEGVKVLFIWPLEIFIFVIGPCIVNLFFYFWQKSPDEGSDFIVGNFVEEGKSQKFISQRETFPAKIVVQLYSTCEVQCSCNNFCASVLNSVQFGNICLFQGSIEDDHAIINYGPNLLLIEDIKD